MHKSLWIKFLVLLITVSAISLSAALLLRELMIGDFREYLEGEMEDRVYWVIADLENTYVKYNGWKEDIIIEDTIWALMLGLEIKIRDVNGAVMMDTKEAIATLPKLMEKRVPAVSQFKASGMAGDFNPYPLFLKGKEIGSVEVRFLRPRKESVFIERSNSFLLISLFALGGIALVLSIVFSKKLTDPIKKLTLAAKAVSKGDFKSRVAISSSGELKTLSDTFNMMAQSLYMQETLRKKLISNVAHELRTPLGVVKSELESMVDGIYPINKETLISMDTEIDRLKSILEGIEDLFEAEASSLSLKLRDIGVKPFLMNITERFNVLFLEKGVHLTLQCDDGLMVRADPDRLSQIIINLLSNALKATEKGGQVLIKADRKDSEVCIKVGDTGIGIKKDDMPFIFERFYKGSPGGLGLGLPIVKELVEAHKGRIEVESEAGRGSTFTVLFPSGKS
ncbi:MAG: HAMP domain-containing histidine kinase [Nitrospirae bacterium]|nr:HAMP domain-containing histidine kinase [Nitrospirota bacterium]